jgi:hypothetical protein
MKISRIENMKLTEYNCLISNIQKELDKTIIQVIHMEKDIIYVLAHNHVSTTYKIKFDLNTFKIIKSDVLGEKSLTQDENNLYIKETYI